ncbi:hypothetical protein HBH56_037990 [Parastagonospora nodorum]|uniref:Uncharacterized protein n=1 Tax=Phaeosphaeria nodorum (strain SN15 / ATCC MYA-4574 / FGSC 10173) TaxID=321614 RepID=A0A7U2I4V7_PHANO|nr:hypothetical protein HBH56_037990 [Parastagonospora nodorum]QRC99901.1 hypothetical protein JI435_068280 [Parastagonospora nodorum SN15]KAH3933660.1 hypothetical protein HBH54_061470 [Parastagonospora nodorum]KAH4142700.1 hypothetical protein HBH45_042440 [Parastagonospora nodorum]KAH4175131.1 hypothetical protein HBH44_006230 [Parastagonospora nodorum]
MSEAGLKVRCLASTRISGRKWPEEQQGLWRRDEDEIDGHLGNSEKVTLFEDNVHALSLRDVGEAQDEAEEKKRSSITGSDAATPANLDSNSDFSGAGDVTNNLLESHVDSRTCCIQEAQLSPDGTCIFTSDFTRSFSVYPIDTPQSDDNTGPLKPYAHFTSPDPIWSFAASPLFDVNDASSTHVLISRRDRYITLHNALWDITQPQPNNTQPINIAHPITSYKLINTLTEAIIAPLSLTYSHSGTHFFASHRNAIATFDLASPSSPIHTITTIPSARSKLKGGGRGFKGWLSSLTLSPPSPFATGGLLTAGSRTRCIGIYDATSGEEITTFSLPGTLDGKKVKSRHEDMQSVMGDGVSYLKYSPCGTYLYVAERQSDALLIYDVRHFSLALGYCKGRNALTNQKLGFDVWNAGASPYDIEGLSHEVWAGGVDGKVRVWRDPYRKEGAVEADEVVVVGEGDAPVVGTMVHASGGLAVAACGKMDVGGDEERKGWKGGGGARPKYKQYGSVDILGLG